MTKKSASAVTPIEAGRNKQFQYPQDLQIKDINDQITQLKVLFPELRLAEVNTEITGKPLPEGAEGYCAIPYWQKIAPTYSDAVKRVLELMTAVQYERFTSRLESEGLSLDMLHQTMPVIQSFAALQQAQPNSDIPIVAVHTNGRYAGQSVEEVRSNMQSRKDVQTSIEFGLDTFSVAIIMLTHFERCRFNQEKREGLVICCPGDNYKLPKNTEETVEIVPAFGFFNGRVVLGARSVQETSPFQIAATAFLHKE